MNQDQVKAALLQLGVSTEDFTLIFSGKASKKVYGLYKPRTKEIIIHNKNFTNDDALMLTAIHELVHHIVITRKLVKTRTFHPVAFWALFHSLMKIAIEKKIYTDPFLVDPDLVVQAEAIMAILNEQFEIQKRLGSALNRMYKLCEEKGARYEDYLDRHARISRSDANLAMQSQAELFGEEVHASPEVINAALSIGPSDRATALKMVAEGASISQIRAAVRQKLIIDPTKDPGEDETDETRLRKLQKKIERIQSSKLMLDRELEEVMAELEETKKQLHLPLDDSERVA